MSSDLLTKEKKSLEEKKEKLKLREQILKEREKKALHKTFVSLGKLVHEAGLSSLDEQTLRGALAELSNSAKDSTKRAQWKKAAELLQSQKDSHEQSQIVIVFQEIPDANTKKMLRDLQFKWNSFRKEFYGYGNPGKIKALTKELKCSVEVIDD